MLGVCVYECEEIDLDYLFIYLCLEEKGRQCKQDRGAKILSLHHQGGVVQILHFQVLIY